MDLRQGRGQGQRGAAADAVAGRSHTAQRGVLSEETGTHQKLAAILAADAAGYSRLMAFDEAGTMAALDAARSVFRAQIESHHGRVVDMC